MSPGDPRSADILREAMRRLAGSGRASSRRDNPARRPRPDWRIRRECTGYHHGQADCALRAEDAEGRHVGHLLYSEFRGTAAIQIVESYRPGVGSELVRRLAREAGGYGRIDWGMVTDDGARLKRKMDREFGYEPPRRFDWKGFVRRYRGRVLSVRPGDPAGLTAVAYVELPRDRMSRFLTAAAKLPLGAPPPWAPDAQEHGDLAWVELALPLKTPATIGGRPVPAARDAAP